MNDNYRIFLIPFFLAYCILAGAHTDSTKVSWRVLPNEELKIKLPAFFEKGEAFEGFIHKTSGTSIVFHQYKDYSYKLYHAGYVKQSTLLNTANTTLTSIDTLAYGKVSGYLYHFNFTPGEVDIEFKRKLFITGDLNNTWLIMINYPEPLEEEMNAYFMESLKTIRSNRK